MKTAFALATIFAAMWQPHAVEIKPVSTINGPISQIRRAEYRVVTSAREWKDLWQRHMGSVRAVEAGKQPAPKVDFDKQYIVAVFQGASVNSSGVVFNSVTDLGGTIRVRFDDLAYQTMGADGGGVPCSAFGFAVIPRHSGKYVFEENVQSMIDGPPIWKQRVSLPVK